MKIENVERLTRLMNPERNLEYQVIRLSNLNDTYACLVTIFEIHTIYKSIEFIDITDILFTVLIQVGVNEKANSIFASCMILTDEIFEFLVIRMDFDIVLMITTKFTLRYHSNTCVFYIFQQLSSDSTRVQLIVFIYRNKDNNNVAILKNKDADNSIWCL